VKLKELIRRIAINCPSEFPFPDNLETYLEDFVPNKLLKSGTLQDAFDLSDYELEEVYNESYLLYQEDRYLESSTGFRWLVLFNPYEPKYWMGLAASLQLLEKYEKALHAYALFALLESDNPYPHFHAYECYSALHNVEEGRKALVLAHRRAVKKSAYRDLQEEIEFLLNNTKPRK
jgi:type III secretion system low calcium response chaperone LcrH/SycD